MPDDDGALEARLRAIGGAFESHREQVDEVLASGDPVAIKQLYVELGDMLESATGDDVEAAPLLSFPETGPVVVDLMGAVHGLILDAGCGPYPSVAIALARDPQRSIVAMDIGLGMVRIGVARARAEGVALNGIVADLEALPFRDRVFDGAVCDDTIEHVPDDVLAMRELARVMKPSGRAVVATPNRIRLDVLREKARDRRQNIKKNPSAYYAATSHLREYTWSDLERVTDRVFHTVQRAVVGWSGGWKAKLASVAIRSPLLRRLSRMVVLVLEPRQSR